MSTLFLQINGELQKQTKKRENQSGIATFESFALPRKAREPIYVTESGKESEVILPQQKNALSPMVLSPDGNVSSVSLPQL